MAEYILKDRYGKEKTFDKETVYVRGTDGELMPFTHGTGNPVLEPLTITENGTYTAPAGVDGYNPVTVLVDPTKITILQETELEESVFNTTFGAYVTIIDPSPFVLTVGQTYLVKWDGVEYECVAQDGSAMIPGAVFIGNAAGFGLEGNNEPFIIGGTLDNGGMCNFLCLTDTEPTVHTVGIWQRVKTEVNLQDKTITENGEYTADSGFDGLGKVTVDVAGAGGGSLPAGLYLQSYEIPPASGTYSHKLFKLNGVIYALVWPYNFGDTTTQFDIYKYASDTWSKVNSTKYSLNLYVSGGEIASNEFIEFNGKVHIFPAENSYKSYHYIFDGQNITTKNSVLTSGSVKPFVESGKLKAVTSSPFKVYVWDEATDTWTEEGTIRTRNFASYDGAIYYSAWESPNYRFFKRKDGVETELFAYSGSVGTLFAVKNGYVYGSADSGGGEITIYETNLNTGEIKKIGIVSKLQGANFYTLGDDDPMLYRGGQYINYRYFFTNYVLHVVRE